MRLKLGIATVSLLLLYLVDEE